MNENMFSAIVEIQYASPTPARSQRHYSKTQCVHSSLQKWSNILNISPFDDGYWIAFHTIFQHVCQHISGIMFRHPIPPSLKSFGVKLQ